MSTAGHGVNIGHGYVKYIVIDKAGSELAPVVFPAQIAPAQRAVAGALTTTPSVEANGRRWWVGEDAAIAAQPRMLPSVERLTDPTFIPALLRGALDRLGGLNGSSSGVCVTGLPSTWALERDKAQALAERLRGAASGYSTIQVIPEPLGLVYAELLDANGQIVGDMALQRGRVGVVDLGHLTDDIVVIDALRVDKTSLATFQTGTNRPLQQIRGLLGAAFGRDYSTHETDLAVRSGTTLVRGRAEPLPRGWERPLIENADTFSAALGEAWGTAANLAAIVVGGGGAEQPIKVAAIQRRYPHALVVVDPQLAIARGYARLARRLALESRP